MMRGRSVGERRRATDIRAGMNSLFAGPFVDRRVYAARTVCTRHSLGGTPVDFLNARLNAASES